VIGKGKGRLKNENSHRTTESTSGHWPFSGLRPRAGVCVFACRRTAVDPATTRRLRTGCDATLQSVRPGRSACLSLHVPLPTLPQPRLPRRILRRPEKEAEAPLRSPITDIAGCCARAARPRCRRAAEQRDELAALHSITSSARASTVAGMSKPSALAVLRLTTSSYLVGAAWG